METTYEDYKSEEARRISESEIFNEAFTKTKELLISRLLGTDPVEQEIRELYYQRIKTLDEVKNALVVIMNEGDIKKVRFKRNA